ncbi:MAG: hypothetical protein OHK0017_09800 [Patescibacteria group bacterium]
MFQKIGIFLRQRDSLTIVLICLILAANIARVWNIWIYSPIDHLFSDPARHWLYTQKPAGSDLFSSIDPIFYQIWLNFVAQITLKNELAVNIYTSLLSLSTPFIWYLLLKEINPGKEKLNLVGWLILSLSPSWLEIYSYFMTETVFLPLFGLSLYLTIKHNNQNKISYSNWGGIILIWLFTVLTRFVAAPFALLSVAYLIYRKPGKAKLILQTILIGLIILVPIGFRNYQIVNVFAPFGYGAMNQIYAQSGKQAIRMEVVDGEKGVGSWEFGSPSLYTSKPPLWPISDWRSSRNEDLKDANIVEIKIDLNHGNADWNNYLDATKPDLAKYSSLVSENILFFYFGESWPDSNSEHLFGNLNYLTRWVWPLLFMLSLIGNLLYLKSFKNLSFFACITSICSIMVIFTLSAVMEGRYRKPFEGLWLLNAIWLLAQIRRRQPQLTS